MTAHYDISISPETDEYKVLLRGPGIEGNGKPYVFRSTERCETFVDAINFAYWEGLRDGLRQREDRGGEFFVVSGTTPDNMVISREGWLRSVKRRMKRRLRF
jgi:hypothetical protein